MPLLHYGCILASVQYMSHEYNWGKPERAPHWSVVDVHIGTSHCVRSMNKKSDRKAIQVLHTSERHVVCGM